MSVQVSIQGFPGSFHDIVAAKLWPTYSPLTRSTFREVFHDVAAQDAAFGVVAIENSIAGAILENYDLLRHSGLVVVGEHYERIVHNLLALPGQKITDITEVWSHPMALKQCQDFLLKHSHIKPVEVDDTARAAKQVSEERLSGVAAIASTRAAELYGMEVLAPAIETDSHNYTRFLIVAPVPDGEQINPHSKLYKTSVYIETDHQPGALLNVLQVFDTFKLNMTMLVSRPIIGKPWSYGFYIDFTHSTREIAGLWEVLGKHAANLHQLGTYRAQQTTL